MLNNVPEVMDGGENSLFTIISVNTQEFIYVKETYLRYRL